MKVKAKSFSKKSGQKLKIKQVTSTGIKKKDKNKSVLKHVKQKPQLFLNDDYLNAKEEEENEEEEDENEDNINSDGGSSDDNESINGDENEDLDHKNALKKLKKTDPEFYKFLEENDKSLLDFNVDDDDDDEDNEDEDNIHKPPEPGELEVHSDEDDFEDEKKTVHKSDKHVTLKMVKQWHDELTSDKSVKTIETVVKAFHAALVSVTGISDEDSFDDFKVEGSAVFNAVVQLCVLELQPALVRFLNLPSENSALAKSQPAKAKKWGKVKTILKNYFTDLLKLLSGVTSDHILCVMLKHVHQLTVFVCYYQRVVKLLLRRLVNLWSESTEETVRVLAFLCILRITTSQQRTWLEPALKMMYTSYISNSKFVSPSTLPGINFMRRSLAELFSIDSGVSYQHAFLYIRQLAVHLRNAIVIQKKEYVQAVCNWQFVSSLRLWVDLLCANHDKSQLEMLLYPLVQVIIGCIKLTPTAQYYPLRFHCCEMLINLSRETGTYIPVLPFILEVLSSTDFDKGHKKLSMKPMDMTCLLRLSKSMLHENAFKDAAIEYVYRLLLNYLATESHRLSFPDLTLLPVINLKQFFKKCKSNKYVQKLRGAVAKIEENSKFIENERKKVSFSLDDKKAIEAWEKTTLIKGTPLNTYCSQLKKIYDQQEAKRITQNDKLAEFKLPVLKRGEKRRNKEEGVVLKLPTDDDDSEDEDSLFRSADDVPLNGETKSKKSKETKKKKKKKTKSVEETSSKEKNNDVYESESDDDDDKGDDVIDFKLSDSE